MADEERETDRERNRVLDAQEIAKSAREDWPTPIYQPAAPAPPPATGMGGWKINWPGVAMPGLAGSPFTFTPPAPVPAAPAGPAVVDRGERGVAAPAAPEPFAFPAPDHYGPTPDFRDPGMLTGVEPGGSVATAADRLVSGQNPDFSKPAPGAGPAPGVAPDVAKGAVSALDIAGPGATAARFKELEALNAKQAAIEEERQATLKPRREARDKALADAQRMITEYETGLAAVRPEAPKLQKMPGVPDMKIRPWLDPEGKRAISVIAETLGMLAVGAAGAYYHTPLTAMKYFREAAENWRRDEVDAANSKFKQFEATVQTIKNDNDVILKEYELADKAFAHNIDAKKAMVATRLDALKLHDQALEVAEKPYDEALKAAQGRAKNTLDMQKAATDYLEAQAKLQKNTETLPKNKLGLAGVVVQANRTLADPNFTDPEARRAVEQKRDTAKQWLDDFRKMEIADAEEKSGNVANIKIGSKRALEGHTLLRSAEYFERQLEKLADDYKLAAAYPGALPASNTLYDKWWSTGLRDWQRLPPNVQGALSNIKTFKNELQVGAGRTFLNDRGVQSIKAFGELGNSIMSFAEARAVLRRWNTMVQDAKRDANRLIREGQGLIDTPGSPPAAPAPETSETPEPE